MWISRSYEWLKVSNLVNFKGLSVDSLNYSAIKQIESWANGLKIMDNYKKLFVINNNKIKWK